MADINGIEIKALKHFKVHGNVLRQASVYMDKRRIGFYSEDREGKLPIKLDCGEEGVSDFFHRVRSCFKDSRLMSDREAVLVFMEELILLHKAEKDYHKAVKLKYNYIMVVHHLAKGEDRFREDETYFISDNESESDVLKRISEECELPAIVKKFASEEDFSINTLR